MKLKKLFLPLSLCVLLLIVLLNINKITDGFASLLEKKPTIVIANANDYAKDYSFEYVKIDTTFIPYSYQDLLNIIYTTLNNGWETFTFYCPAEYVDCVNDVEKITEDEILLTNINNFVHPYNSFSNIKTIYDKSGEVTFKLTKLYTSSEIKKLNKIVETIIDENITSEMDDETKIKIIHDYIINNTVYDNEENLNISKLNKTNTAVGALVDHKALCGGYSDAMALFLSEFGIKNYKVASDTHVWNALKINGEWKHLDLTWDDPISDDGQNYLLYKFFLLSTSELHKQDVKTHTFDYLVYREFKNS